MIVWQAEISIVHLQFYMHVILLILQMYKSLIQVQRMTVTSAVARVMDDHVSTQ